MTAPVRQCELVPIEPVPKPEPIGAMAMFERLARDPDASVDKIERLMALWERNETKLAEERFNAAMSEAQQAMAPVRADAVNPQTRSKYASYEALDRALRPIYTKHGFGLSFDTGEGAPQEWTRMLCYVTHSGGFKRIYHADIPADGKGARGGDVMTRTHAVGSSMSYGMRYLLRMIFNVAVDDDDGNGAGGKDRPEPPTGYDDFLSDLTAVADEGTEKLKAAWTKAKAEFRSYLSANEPQTWATLKAKAAKVKP